MSDDQPVAPKRRAAGKTAGFSVGGAVLVLLFVWIVFDNFALAFLFALVAGAAGASAARLKS
ncbi:MAG: hypothetical protein RKE49_08330 [Oceanicaulis sp.]